MKLVPAERDGVVPDGYHATTLFPEYYHLDGRWVLAEDSRMDCVAVARGGRIEIVEFRNVKAGDPVVVGRTEDGSEGIYIHPNCFTDETEQPGGLRLPHPGRSRETAYSIDYDELYQLLRHEREHGNIPVGDGPRLRLRRGTPGPPLPPWCGGGYVHGLMAGNALATHDLEASYLGTALWDRTSTPRSPTTTATTTTLTPSTRCGGWGPSPPSWSPAPVTDGIMYECVRHQVPFALVGSRPSGTTAPCPEVYGDVYQGQDAMRELVREGHHHHLHGLHPAHRGHRQHDPQLPGGGWRGSAPCTSTRWTSPSLR